MSTTKHSHPLAVHDTLLLPVLRNASRDDTVRAALSVTCRGLEAGIPVSVIRRWLILRGGERFVLITRTPKSFQRIAKKARRHRAASSDLAARRERVGALSALLIGSLLTPLPASSTLTPARVRSARQALAIVGLDAVESIREHGWDGVLVNQRELAVRMGVTPGTAGSALRAACTAGWLIRRTEPRGGSARYALRRRLRREARDAAYRFGDAVDAIADRLFDVDPVADLVLSVSHPAWSHGRGAAQWLTALAVEAEIDPVLLGVPARRAFCERRSWLRLHHESAPEATLVEMLDEDAEVSGARSRRGVAEAARRAEAEARATELTVFKTRRAKVRVGLDGLLAAHPIPRPTAPVTKRRAWLDAIGTAVAGSDAITDPMREDLAELLAQRMMWPRHGYDAETARRVARRIAGLGDQVAA